MKFMNLAFGIVAMLLSGRAMAQENAPGLAGTYEVLTMDGQPIQPGVTWHNVFVPVVGTPFFVSVQTRTDANGTEIRQDPDSRWICMPDGDGWTWMSLGGGSAGVLTPMSAGYLCEFHAGEGAGESFILERVDG